MNIYLKSISTAIFIYAFTAMASAYVVPNGVYLTYEDFKNGNLQIADKGDITYHGNSHKVTMKLNGVKQSYDGTSAWGFTLKGDLYRLIKHPTANAYLACRLTRAGDYCVWLYYETMLVPVEGSPNTLTYLTYGIGGKPFIMYRKKEMEKAVAEQKELKPLLDCASQNAKGDFFYNLISCVQTLPGYIQDPQSIYPKIKNH